MEQNRTVKTIPATRAKFTSAPISEPQTRKVAGYARVSTDHDDQFSSYEAQIDYYTNYIKSRPDWEFVKVYTDEGITGTSTKHREGFKQMVEDALAGKIDLIVTKSVSRFARNTVDSLTTIRQFKEKGIEVYFEKENIWTFDGKGELLLTIMSSIAQEESRSISENCTWGQRKRFADGKVTVPFRSFLGYDRGPDGNLVVNQEQAVIVRRIYSLFLQGNSFDHIAKILTEDGVPTPSGKSKKWCRDTVESILKNEKYKGDALLQKTYCVDFLTKKYKVNEGEIPQYYVENNHEAIIEPATFDMVQREIERRKGSYHSSLYPFSGRIRCGQCGGWYGSRVWHSNDKYRRVVWQCCNKYRGKVICRTPHFTTEEIEEAFMKAVNQLLSGKKEVIANANEMMDTLYDTSSLEQERDSLTQEAKVLYDKVQSCIGANARTSLNQDDYERHYNELCRQYEKKHARLEEISSEINKRKTERTAAEYFIREFESLPDQLENFSIDVWSSLVEDTVVYSKDDIRFTFRNGQEIRV